MVRSLRGWGAVKQIAVAGHLCVDLTPTLAGAPSVAPGQLVEVGGLTITLGGSVANTGRGLAALGADVSGLRVRW